MDVLLLLSLLLSVQALSLARAAPSPPPTSPNLADSHLLKDVVRAVADRQNWGAGEVRALDLRVRDARRRRYRRLEFGIRAGEGGWAVRFVDEVTPWRRLKKGALAGAVSGVVLDEFTVVGPAEIGVRSDEEEFSLHYPLNFTVTGMKRILISEGIAVNVQGAKEIFLNDLSKLYPPTNGSSIKISCRHIPISFLSHSCERLFPVKFSGSPSLVAYRISNPLSQVKAIVLSKDTVHLFQDKSYNKHFSTTRKLPIKFLDKSIALVELLLHSSFGVAAFNNQVPSISSAKVTALNMVQFELEIVRSLSDDDAYLKSLAEWRTKPKVECVWYKVVARVETDVLKPIVLKKLKPFVAVDSVAWSTFTSNISYTQLPSALVFPEALTLDLKW